MWLVQIVFWLQAFISPVILLSLVGLLIRSEKAVIALLIIGAVAGVVTAEYIRRNIGLDTFFGRIYGPNEMDEKLKKKKETK